MKLTDRQEQAQRVLAGDATHCMLFGGSRCVAGDTILDGHTADIATLARLGQRVIVQTTRGPIEVDAPFAKGKTALLKVDLDNGLSVKVTPDHRFWDGKAWVKAETLTPQSSVAVLLSETVKPIYTLSLQSVARLIDAAWYRICQAVRMSCDTPKAANYSIAKVLRVTQSAEETYYTLHVPVAEHYSANGILHHNSGKTFLLTRNVCLRALKAPKSRHAILRFRFNAVKASVVMDTFPKVMELAFPGVKYTLSKTDWYAEFENGSQIWFGGLDDKERAEKILGMEFATIYLNEASQIPKASRDIAVTRLAQQVNQVIKGAEIRALKPRMLYDCNPPSKAHWTYKLFVEKRDPETKLSVPKPDDYAHFQINPMDNAANVSAGYLETLQGLSTRLQKRFLRGEFADATPNALFSDEMIDKWRVNDGVMPEMVRIVVAVDPSGADDVDNADNDAIGIMVVGLGVDGICYVMEDLTIKAGPATWGRIVCDAYDRHSADAVIGETNYGGAMVQHVIQTARPRTNFKKVTATRGKIVRAEPISALYEQGKVRHVGYLRDLEDELMAFTTNGFIGNASPNRADAAVWGITALFPSIVNPRKESYDHKATTSKSRHHYGSNGAAWMGT